MNKPLPVTFYITEIWPTYADFKTFTDSIPLDTTEAADDAFNEWIYNRLCRYYDEWPVRYDTPAGFANDFAVIYEDLFYQYKAQRARIDDIYKITPEELLNVTYNVTNSAVNDNNVPTDPKAALPFVSAQATGWGYTGKLQGYVQALNSMPALRLKSFLDSFKDLFAGVLIPQIYIYEKTEGDF